MRTLLHMPFDPACRIIRMHLSEKGLIAKLEEIYPWAEYEKIAAHNPAGTIPVLIDEPPSGGNLSLSPTNVIVEYIEDAYSADPFLPSTSAGRAEARRLFAWFDQKFEHDVTARISRERIDKRLQRRGQPDYDVLKSGLEALSWHFDYLTWLLESRSWLAGERLTIADFSAVAHVSVLDYVDAIEWEKYPIIRDWYAKLKSRPSMRPILNDRIDGLPPPAHYVDLDF